MSVSYKRLGQHGVLVSNLCLGTMNFGWHTSEEDSFAIMDRALALGINFFDTADVYGWSVEHGLTEEIIGRWFAQGGGRRDAVVLATKVFNPVECPSWDLGFFRYPIPKNVSEASVKRCKRATV